MLYIYIYICLLIHYILYSLLNYIINCFHSCFRLSFQLPLSITVIPKHLLVFLKKLFCCVHFFKLVLTLIFIHYPRIFGLRNAGYFFRFFTSFLLLMIYHRMTTFPLSTTWFQGPYPKISTDFWRRVHLRASIKGWRIKIGGGKLWEWRV